MTSYSDSKPEYPVQENQNIPSFLRAGLGLGCLGLALVSFVYMLKVAIIDSTLLMKNSPPAYHSYEQSQMFLSGLKYTQRNLAKLNPGYVSTETQKQFNSIKTNELESLIEKAEKDLAEMKKNNPEINEYIELSDLNAGKSFYAMGIMILSSTGFGFSIAYDAKKRKKSKKKD